jgi:hypothetical protein
MSVNANNRFNLKIVNTTYKKKGTFKSLTDLTVIRFAVFGMSVDF